MQSSSLKSYLSVSETTADDDFVLPSFSCATLDRSDPTIWED